MNAATSLVLYILCVCVHCTLYLNPLQQELISIFAFGRNEFLFFFLSFARRCCCCYYILTSPNGSCRRRHRRHIVNSHICNGVDSMFNDYVACHTHFTQFVTFNGNVTNFNGYQKPDMYTLYAHMFISNCIKL